MYFLIITSIFAALLGTIYGVDEASNPVTELTSQSNTFCEAGVGRDYFKCKPSQVEYFASSNSNDEKIVLVTFDDEHKKLALCAEPAGDVSQVNLMLHVFCRQMGYTTYVSRRTTNIMEDSDRAIIATALCYGTEQRLEDCHWPNVTLTRCKQVIEVNCGSCSKYFSHVDDGMISTPGFPLSFPYTVQCDWLIHTHLGSEIELRFLAFNFPQSLLPLAHIGTSMCEASSAFIEIRSHPFNDNSSDENKTIANAERYCVTNNPPRRLVIKSKAVWLHFSSGIHSSFISSYRSRSSTKRAIGLKIHFKALPGLSSGNNSQYYVYAGACALFALLIFTTVACCIYFHKKRNAWNEEPELSYSNKWPRSICSSGISRQASKSCRKTLESRREHMLSHNYEEIAPRPQVPPRPFRPVSNLTWSSDDARRIAVARRPALSYRSPPTYQSRHNLLPMHYMQLVCDSGGNCQYIPKEEIEAAALTHRIIPRIYGSNVFAASDVPPYPKEEIEPSNTPPSSSSSTAPASKGMKTGTKRTPASPVKHKACNLQSKAKEQEQAQENDSHHCQEDTKDLNDESNAPAASLSSPSCHEESSHNI